MKLGQVKVLHVSPFLGKDGSVMLTVWCIVKIGNREFQRTFYVPKKGNEALLEGEEA